MEQNFLLGLGAILALISVLAFFVGIIFLFIKDKRELGLKIILGSVITFVIGFGSCAANFKI